MQVLPRWRNPLLFKISFVQSTAATTSFITSSSSLVASFHSTPTSLEKWKNKWNSDITGQQPSKTYIRYATRQKRSDAKKALNDLLFNSGSSKITFEDEFPKGGRTRRWDENQDDYSDSTNKKERSKSSARRASKAHLKRMRRKLNSFGDFDENHTTFHATFGDRWYTWAFKSWEESSSQNSTTGFEWRDNMNWTSGRNKEWNTASDAESDDESYVVGSYSDRTLLGLPSKGPLKIEDVKNAFRLSALKWHPDKHQGRSQAKAEEKFKSCVNAYKSLCNSLSRV